MSNTKRVDNKRAGKNRKGGVFIYSVFAMGAFIGATSLAVDWGKVVLTKNELHSAADAAALAGAALANDGASYARSEAKRVGALNKIGNESVTLRDEDVVVGKWDATNRTIDQTSLYPDAVQVTTNANTARGNPIRLMFAGYFSSNYTTFNATKTSTAVWVRTPSIKQDVYATANPFLAGMPAGTKASDVNPHRTPKIGGIPDIAGDENSDDVTKRIASPQPAMDSISKQRVSVGEGMNFTFESIEGDARHDPGLPYFAPDGELADIGHNNLTTSDTNSKSSTLYNENHIHDVVAPINALVGVFLADDAPTNHPLPDVDRYDADAPYDYSRPEERNRTVYKPQLQQIFFIGDGLTDDGIRQTFVAPKGATRLYLATWDFYEWNNNAGKRSVVINPTGHAMLVK